jgi:hypothetical protein
MGIPQRTSFGPLLMALALAGLSGLALAVSCGEKPRFMLPRVPAGQAYRGPDVPVRLEAVALEFDSDLDAAETFYLGKELTISGHVAAFDGRSVAVRAQRPGFYLEAGLALSQEDAEAVRAALEAGRSDVMATGPVESVAGGYEHGGVVIRLKPARLVR